MASSRGCPTPASLAHTLSWVGVARSQLGMRVQALCTELTLDLCNISGLCRGVVAMANKTTEEQRLLIVAKYNMVSEGGSE